MSNESWTPDDYLVLVKAYIKTNHRHMEEESEQDFWVTLNEVFNNHPDCRLIRRLVETRSTFVTFTRACQRYRITVNTVKKEDLFHLTQAACDSRYLWEYHIDFVRHAAYNIWDRYIRQFE